MNRGKSSANPAELSQLDLNSAGIDVGTTSHFVAVPADRAEQPVQEFEAFTADLYRLADWLTECGVETVAMESTKLDKIKNLYPEVRISLIAGGSIPTVLTLAPIRTHVVVGSFAKRHEAVP